MGYLLSICIPTYNREKKIKNMLHFLDKERVLGNDNIEVIVSNNCSSDDTAMILHSYNSSNLFTFNQNVNLGLIGNLLFLQNNANGKFVWFIGDDDILYPGIFDKVLHVLSNYSDIHHLFINYSES